MSTAAIVLLILGILFFAGSFFLPDGKKQETVNAKIDEKMIKDMVEKEVQSARERIDDMVEETVSYSVEKTERQLEKVSNEKIMAVEEYSDTVLKKINDNHQEAVFLYDMLNDKSEKLKNTDEALKEKKEELSEKGRELEVKEEVLKARTEDLEQIKEEIKAETAEKAEEPAQFVPFIPERIAVETNEETGEATVKTVTPAQTPKPRTVKKPVTGKQQKGAIKLPEREKAKKQESSRPSINADNEVELHFDRDNEGKKNSNELIRKLHEEGKSNMAIAKELGLGVGEVKLVIDLFANKK